MRYLITGGAGFIGSHLVERLISLGHSVNIIDNFSTGNINNIKNFQNKTEIIKADITEYDQIVQHFKSIDCVFHLAALADIVPSIEKPDNYYQSNVNGTFNVLEACRHHNVEHLVYASSSSVYGLNEKMPFSTQHNVDHPISLYGATKRSNELMAHTYAHLYSLPTTGLRFFTVYGPWGRPDMALFLFTKAILSGEPIDVYNHLEMKRDFTYIDDLVAGICLVIQNPSARNQAFNMTYGSSRSIMELVNITKEHFIDVEVEFVERDRLTPSRGTMNIKKAQQLLDYSPQNPIEVGFPRYINWYKEMHEK